MTGHSLGGALATLAAIYIKETFVQETKDKLKLFTFGSLRVGDINFAMYLN